MKTSTRRTKNPKYKPGFDRVPFAADDPHPTPVLTPKTRQLLRELGAEILKTFGKKVMVDVRMGMMESVTITADANPEVQAHHYWRHDLTD